MTAALQLRHLGATVLLATFALGACGKSKPEADPVADVAETKSEEAGSSDRPVLMHTRLQYRLGSKTTSAKVNATSEVSYKLQLQTPLLREGRGHDATYRGAEAGDKVEGEVVAIGQATLKDSDISTTESLNLAHRWPNMVPVVDGSTIAMPPELSLTGEGMAIRLKLDVPVEGSQSATITNAQGSMTSDVMLSRPLPCVKSSATNQETCKLELTLEPVPTAGRDEGGKLMLPKIKEALAQPNGEWAMALLGQVYGATTEWRADGGFVLRFNRDYQLTTDGTTIMLEVKALVWTAAPGDNTEPKPAA